jgi:hypothetical protein
MRRLHLMPHRILSKCDVTDSDSRKTALAVKRVKGVYGLLWSIRRLYHAQLIDTAFYLNAAKVVNDSNSLLRIY